MWRPKVLPLAFSVLFAVGLSTAFFSLFSWNEISDLTKHLSVYDLALACSFVCVAHFFSSLRFQFICRFFSLKHNYQAAFKINVVSAVFALLPTSIIPQIISRSLLGQKSKAPAYVAVTLLEKSLTLLYVGGACAISSFYLFQRAYLEGGFFLALGFQLVLLVLLSAIGMLFSRKIPNFKIIRECLIAVPKARLGVIGISTALTHLCFIGAYWAIARNIVEVEFDFVLAFGLFSVVIAATTIPIGFGGWGVRELSVATLFFYLSMPYKAGVIVGVIFGSISLLVIFILAMISLLIQVTEKNNEGLLAKGLKITWLRYFVVAIFVSLPFSIHFPSAHGGINISLSDPIVLAVGLSFLGFAYANGSMTNIFLSNKIWLSVLLIWLVLVSSFFLGLITFGSNSWAVQNRLMGYPILICYLLSGAACAYRTTENFGAKLFIILGFSIMAGVLAQFFLSHLFGQIGVRYFAWNGILSGFFDNRNAFAITTSLAMAGMVINFKNYTKHELRVIVVPLLLCLAISIIISGSRSGAVCLILLLLLLLLLVERKRLAQLGFVSLLLVGFQSLVTLNIVELPASMTRSSREIVHLLSISNERYSTWSDGLDAFFAAPALGKGLGFIINSNDFVVHNTWIWLMAETGMIGLVCVILAFFLAFLVLIGNRHQISRTKIVLLTFVAFVFIINSQVHELLFTRIFWLLMGFCFLNNKLMLRG